MPIFLIVIKASVLLAAALAGAWLLRATPAATRHALWSATFAALLALPWLGAALPSLSVPVPSGWTAAIGCAPGVPGLHLHSCVPAAGGAAASSATWQGEVVPGVSGGTPAPVTSRAVPGHDEPTTRASPSAAPSAVSSIGTVARAVWLAGAAAAAGALLLSLLRVRRLARSAEELADPAWHEAVRALGARLALRRPARVVVSPAVRTPMAGGLWRPQIFLPPDAPSWTPAQRDVVLAHELSHIARRDPLRHVAARLAVTCYWFHPLAWLAARQSSLAREQACDEAVLALGFRPSEYARVLVDLAESMAPLRPAAALLPMVERSLLETRLMAILDPSTRPSRLRPIVPVAGAALLALTLAAARPVARAGGVATPTPVTPPTAVSPVGPVDAAAGSAAQPSAGQAGPETACQAEDADRGSFTGYTNTDSRGRILERAGTSGTRRIIQQRFNALRVCMLVQDAALDRGDRPSAWAGFAERVMLETAGTSSTARLDIRRSGGATQTTWRVNGADRPLDASAQAWRDALLAVLDPAWAMSALRGEESSLRGDISSLRGDESSLRGDISSIHGDISSLRGDISSVRGDESSLRGDISSIQGQLSSLQGDISSERGAISALQAERYGMNDRERARAAREIEAHQAEIARVEREIAQYDAPSKIAEVEKQLRALNADAKVAEIETQIRAYGEQEKIAAIQKQIAELNVEGNTAEIERRIAALDVDARTREFQKQLDEAVKRLERALASIK